MIYNCVVFALCEPFRTWHLWISSLLEIIKSNSDSIIIGIFTLVGATVGVWLTNLSYMKRTEKEQKRKILSLCRAMLAELGTLKYALGKGIGNLLYTLKSDEPLLKYLSGPKDPCIIFKSNCNLLPDIPDTLLLFRIINTYLKINSFLDLIDKHNMLFDVYKQYKHLPENNPSRVEKLNNVKKATGSLKDSYMKMEVSVKEVIQLLRQELGISSNN